MDEEYLAKLGIDHADFDRAIDSVLSQLGQLEARFPNTANAVSQASKAFGIFGAAARESGREQDNAGAAATRNSKRFLQLARDLKVAQAAYTEYLRGQATGLGGGTNITAYSPQQSAQLLATARAQGTSGSFVSALKAQESAHTAMVAKFRAEGDADAAAETAAAKRKADASEAADTAMARSLQRLNAQRQTARDREIAAEQAATNRAVAQDAAEVERRTQLRARGYSADLAAAEKVDSQIAAAQRASDQAAAAAATQATQAQQARRYATVPSAAGRTADPGLEAAAQSQYSRQALADQSALYASQQRLSDAQQKSATAALPRLRYALYDVSRALAVGGAAALATGVAVEKTAIDYQNLFASVQRTSGLDITNSADATRIASLRRDLVGLTQQLPVTFADITKIATLGNQLGIASQNIVPFTKTVAQFSATTNVGVEDAATAFGRLGQILHDSNYRAIGDDIAYLGVRSVATESQIINTAQQIAVSTAAVHYSTQETLALATATSSLGVKPEQARGSFIRAFGAISAAVSAGGTQLNNLASVSGLTADQFRTQWQTDASGAFTKFVTGLGTSSASVKDNLAGLHITAARDVQTFGLLAQNSDVLTKAQTDAGNAAGYLNKAYGVQADTVAAKSTILLNTLKSVADDIGTSLNGPLSSGIDLLSTLAKILDDIVQNPFAAWTAAGLVALVSLVGGAALLAAGLTRVVGAGLAFEQIINDDAVAENRFGAEVIRVAVALGLVSKESAAAARAQATLAASSAEAATGEAALAGATTEAGLAQTGAAGAGLRLTGVIGKLGLAGAVIGAALAVPSLVSALKDFFDQATGRVKDVDQLTQAIQNLGKAGSSDALKSITTALPSGQSLATRFVRGPSGFDPSKPGGLGAAAPITMSGAEEVYKQITGLYANRTHSSSTVTANSVSTDIQQIQNIDKTIAGFVQGGDLADARKGFDLFAKSMDGSGLSSKQLHDLLLETNKALAANGDASLDSAGKAQTAAQAAATSGAAFKTYLDTAYGDSIKLQAAGQAVQQLGTEYGNNGAVIAFSGSQMTAAISAIFDASHGSAEAASNLQGFFNALVNGGYASASQLSNLSDIISSLSGGSAVTATPFDLSGFVSGLNSVTTSATTAATAVRTLEDYGNDIGTVLQRAFDLRFASGTGLDAFTKGFLDLKVNATDLSAKLKQLRADLRSLQSDRAVNTYHLGVANEYGDSLRAGVLRADIGKNNTDIAAKNKEIADSQATVNRSLKGNTTAAIANRAALEAIISSGKDYLVTLAKNGASQDTLRSKAAGLKKSFEDQAIQLGFSKRDVGHLAGAFDDMSTVISKVPKNVTVKVGANTSPALLALAEFDAKAKAQSQKHYSAGTLDPLSEGLAAQKDVRRQALEAIIAAETASLRNQAAMGHTSGGLDAELGANAAALRAGNYRAGGYTGAIPPWQIAGVVHGDEYVLNSSGRRLIPQQMLDAANRGVAPLMPVVNTKVNVAGGSMLSRDDKAFLAAVVSRAPSVAISADQFGAAMDGAYVRAGRRGAN